MVFYFRTLKKVEMVYLTALLIGFTAAFLGVLAPSMLNMTSAKLSIERGKFSVIQFSLGAALILMVHCSIAVYFAKYLVANPHIITNLKIVAIFVFILLAIFFYLQAKREKEIKGKEKNGHPFVIGLGMASINMLGIPFYLAMATLAESKGWLSLKNPDTLFFTAGAFIGDFLLFSLYAIFAEKIAQKATFIAKNINYILSLVFVFLSFSTIYQVLA